MFRAFDGTRAPKGPPPLDLGAARGAVYFTDFREGGGNTIKSLIRPKAVATTANMETSDWGRDSFGGYLDFDGVDEHAQYGADFATIIPSTTAPFTVEAWAKADGYPTTRDGIVTCDSGSGTQGFGLRLENSGGSPANGFVFSVGNFAGDAAYVAAADFTVTDLNHYVGRYDGTNLTAFVNARSGVADTSSGAGLYTNPMYFGVHFNDAFADRNFNGKLYMVRISNRALSDGEIAARHNARTRFNHYRRQRIRAIVPVPPVGGAKNYYLGGNAMNRGRRGIGWAA